MESSSELINHMRGVQTAERDLHDLGLWWQMIESSAAISCPDAVGHILPTLVRTRERFVALQKRLVERMAGEHSAALGDELLAKAQCSIDILVRNLFERTADVGFLATDDTLRAFCVMSPDERAGQHSAVVGRLRDYCSKYTVYDDIVLLATDGTVLARLAEGVGTTRSTDPLIAQALASDTYVERHAPSDLAAGDEPVLLYARRIERADSLQPVGVLVLKFRFADEMTRIFAGVTDPDRDLVVMLLDDDGRVVASNDDAHVPLGARMRALPPDEVRLTHFAGREYLAVVSATHGYQGYTGPGWRAQAMVSLLTAFRGNETAEDMNVPLDNAELAAICVDADAINRDLRRAVWNGRIDQRDHSADARRMTAVLTQVNHAGHRTRERVDQAIRGLYGTSIERIRRQAVDLARLAADIMDRNLYERANDCRWWALSPSLCRALDAPLSATGTQALNAELDRINGLYTVYSRLVVFDSDGCTRGASQDPASEKAGRSRASMIGEAVDAKWLQAARGLTSGQAYAVSDFVPCALHDGGDTYVYLAAMREPGSNAFIGGIAVVFHSRREFDAMLREVMGTRAGMAGFVDAQGCLLAGTDDTLAHADFKGVPTDGSTRLVTHAGTHYACARVKTTGYREFKTTDGYDNGVAVLVALRLGTQERRRSSLADQRLEPVRQGDPSIDVAVCQVGAGRYALPTDAVVEAIPHDGLVRTPAQHPLLVGLLEVQGGHLVPVLCARKLFGLTYPARASDGVVLVLHGRHSDKPALGLRVDDVISVLAVQRDAVHAPPGAYADQSSVSGLIDCRVIGHTETALVQMLSPERLLGLLPSLG